MSIDELIKAMKEMENDEAFKKFVNERYITKDAVKAFLETPDGKKLIQPLLDSYFAKGLETWKEKTLPGILDEKIKEKFPDETPEQKRLRNLEDELAKERQGRIKSELLNKATQIATQKGLPIEVVQYFVGQDEDTTLTNLGLLEAAWQRHTEKVVSEKFKDNGRQPEPGNKNGDGKINPWSKETFNLTEQGRILKTNPELARKLMAAK